MLVSIILLRMCRGRLSILLQLVKKFPSFYGTWMFITMFTRTRHLLISWGRWMQFPPSEQIYLRFILILSSNLCLVLPIGLFRSGFLTTTLYAPLFSPMHAGCSAHLIPLDLITRITFAEVYRSCSSSLCSLLHSLVTSSLLGSSIFLSTPSACVPSVWQKLREGWSCYCCQLFIFLCSVRMCMHMVK